MENRIGFGKRLGALLIDCVICGIVVGVAGPLIGGFLGASAGATLGGMGAGTNAGSAAMTGGAFGSLPSTNAKIAVINWNTLLLYPAGENPATITVTASLKAPAGWKNGGCGFFGIWRLGFTFGLCRF